jgi:LSD1 subclass zinc finger protein
MCAALQTLGARLRAAGATPAAHRAPDPEDLAAAVERLRERLTGTSEPDGLTVEQREAYIARYKPDNAKRALGRSSGWRQLPQCGGCRAILKYPGAQCKACGLMGEGEGG